MTRSLIQRPIAGARWRRGCRPVPTDPASLRHEPGSTRNKSMAAGRRAAAVLPGRTGAWSLPRPGGAAGPVDPWRLGEIEVRDVAEGQRCQVRLKLARGDRAGQHDTRPRL